MGLVAGIGEDLLAIFFATDAEINLNVIWIVFLVAIPFAFLSEVIVDHPRFWEKLIPIKPDFAAKFKKNSNNKIIKNKK
ncbi:MAG: hypothetical protein COV29_00820 [Candidatus Yanofskybacteria bacterium CG10_big_fil_rev_8_21_14_0_10_36_16]|uniref:Uncharacterized protein n=1 Tax=Candidatus Yanofskybacteria bacterium CG10_big_fil_rev_8_21_14_0_10_36_16 TaxID=1975096 RepID=A0A2J0Q809_9BACT|nr:MAG: hypothetical protein COV29_00820 [Candidatus Yanofskybacteria bacterium CG10_big_fil_rev_8_21_14_0_10_36_16]